MYSVVLMMAMTSQPDTAAFFGKHGGCQGSCTGCYGGGCCGGGCYGSSYGGCCGGGGCYGSCYGGGCSGCYGGGCHGGKGGLFGKKHRGGGGCCGGGGCYGGGCWGSSYGGCCGGGYGGCMGYGGGCMGYGGGCYGGGYMGGYMGGSIMTAPAAPAAPPTGPAPKPAGGAMFAAPATIVVSLPADAILKVDGNPTKATSDLRAFATPVLPAGQAYHYTLTASVVRNGQPLTAVQQVTVRGGETSRIEIPANVFGQTVALK